MSHINLSQFVQKAEQLAEQHQLGVCIALLNSCGEKEFFISIGSIKPCSIKLSELKAKTAYQFTADNDQIYSLLKQLGDTPLFSEDYCFIPGGKFIPNLFGQHKYLGVSSTDPSKDAELAKSLVEYLYLGEKS